MWLPQEWRRENLYTEIFTASELRGCLAFPGDLRGHLEEQNEDRMVWDWTQLKCVLMLSPTLVCVRRAHNPPMDQDGDYISI